MISNYRIRKTFSGYEVEKKCLWFFWINPFNDEWMDDLKFSSYEKAKLYLENHLRDKEYFKERKKEREAFKDKFFYPPFSDEELT